MLRAREQRMAVRAHPRRSLRIQTLRTTQLLIATSTQSTDSLHLILHSPLNPPATSPSNPQAKSPLNASAAYLDPREAASIDNDDIPLIALPLEVFHRISSHLPATSLLYLKYSCRSTFLKLCYQQANLVWYKAVPPALLRRWQYREGEHAASTETPLSILGGPYTDNINYQYEIMQYMKTSKRCCKCLSKLSIDERLAGFGWGKPGKNLCRPCFDGFRISRYRVQAYICGLPQGRAINAKLDALTVQLYQNRSYLYRPSVDLLIREALSTSGLSDLELNLTLDHQQEVTICSRRSEAEKKKKIFYDFMTKTAESIWEYLAIVCVPDEQLVKEVAENAFDRLAEQLNMEEKSQRDLLNHMMHTWFHNATTLDPSVIHRIHARFARTISPFFPSLLALDGWNPLSTSLSSDICIYQCLRLVIELVDIDAPEYSKNAGSIPAWRDACKDWHRKRIMDDITSGRTMRMETVPEDAITRNGHHLDRGLQDIRRKLGLHEYPLQREHYQHINSKGHQGDIARSAFERGEKKEKATKKYFDDICVRSAERCPGSGMLVNPVGLESVLEHMANGHAKEFWVGEWAFVG